MFGRKAAVGLWSRLASLRRFAGAALAGAFIGPLARFLQTVRFAFAKLIVRFWALVRFTAEPPTIFNDIADAYAIRCLIQSK
ncbi:hypothetical protein PTKU15_79940 [Paraburkholderia terrae]|nr:hypothetical protein PTKU15_79940 [Paraburkholderia terrae]